jgi:p-aminobenzoyl-glutamate transporter AbgT
MEMLMGGISRGCEIAGSLLIVSLEGMLRAGRIVLSLLVLVGFVALLIGFASNPWDIYSGVRDVARETDFRKIFA